MVTTSEVESLLTEHNLLLSSPVQNRERFLPTKEVLEKLYWTESLNQSQIARLFGCNQVTISNYMKKYRIKRRSDGRFKAREFNFVNCKELGYFCGLVLGDGFICKPRKSSGFLGVGSTKQELIDLFCNSAKKLGFNVSISHRIQKRKFPCGTTKTDTQLNARVYSEVVYQLLRPFKKSDYFWDIPSFLISQEAKIGFLQGIFDAEGSVAKDGLTIILSSKHRENLEQVSKILREFGINSKIYTSAKCEMSFLKISRVDNRILFARLIGFRLERKQSRIRLTLKRYKWIEKDEEFLRGNRYLPDKVLARQLGRTIPSIRIKRRQLGIKKCGGRPKNAKN